MTHLQLQLHDDDAGLHVLGCRVDILGINCKTSASVPSLAIMRCQHCVASDASSASGADRTSGPDAAPLMKRPLTLYMHNSL